MCSIDLKFVSFKNPRLCLRVCVRARANSKPSYNLCGLYSEASGSHSYWIADMRSDNPWLEMFAIALNAVGWENE